MDKKRQSKREREIVASAMANEDLMEAVRESLAEAARGEPLIPGKLVREEAQSRRAKSLQA